MLGEYIEILHTQVKEMRRIISLFPGLELKKIHHAIEIKEKAIARLTAYAAAKGINIEMGLSAMEGHQQNHGKVGGRRTRNSERTSCFKNTEI